MHQLQNERALTVRDVLVRLGAGLLTVASAGAGLDRPVAGVTIHDPLLPIPAGTDEVLLAVGVDPDSPAAPALLHAAAGRRYSAVVLHATGSLPAALGEEARRHGIALLASPLDVPWVHLAAMLRVGIGTGRRQEVAGVALGDLFAFASVLAAEIAGAVTIEDPQSRVLAYSTHDGEVDEPRKETILGRQVPQRYTRLIQEKGVLRRLLSGDDIVHMEAIPDVGLRARVAVSVRAAGEILGFIWVAEAGRPLVADHERILREAAQTAALHIVRHRLDLLQESTARRALVRELVEGGSAPDLVAVRLGIDHDATYAVVAFEVPGGGVPTERLLGVVDLYCSTLHRGTLSVDVGPRVYAVLPLERPDDLRRFAGDAARRVSDAIRARVLVGIGSPVPSADGVVRARREADRVLRVLLRGPVADTVATLDDVRAQANVLEILDVLREREDLREGRVAGLDPALRQTLREYLDHFGDVGAAAQALQTHPNTVRYRLRRVTELTGMDLTDPSERLMASLQLRLLT
ncbi:MAG: transcriptional regulator [Mycobacterium sp.]|nr:transcriptional regulator [Mycobacterium sp.]